MIVLNISDDITFAASIISGLLLIISEILPFVKTIESNGILDAIMNYGKNKQNNPEETDRLLSDTENVCSCDSKCNEILDILKNKKIEDSKSILQLSKDYELNYISTYIKHNYPKRLFQIQGLSEYSKGILENFGYTIDYDSIYDTYTVKW